jgi:hypothetical protein
MDAPARRGVQLNLMNPQTFNLHLSLISTPPMHLPSYNQQRGA